MIPYPNINEIHYKKPIISQKIAWLTTAKGQKVANFFIAAQAKTPIKICQVHAYNAVYPGTVTVDGCLITYAGKTEYHSKYKILTVTNKNANNALHWGDVDLFNSLRWNRNNVDFLGVLPKNSNFDIKKNLPVIGGYESQNPNYLHPLYICRTMNAENIVIGKVVNYRCYYANGNRENNTKTYQILFLQLDNK